MVCPKCKKGKMIEKYELTTPADVNFTCDNCGFYKHTDETTIIVQDKLGQRLRKSANPK